MMTPDSEFTLGVPTCELYNLGRYIPRGIPGASETVSMRKKTVSLSLASDWGKNKFRTWSGSALKRITLRDIKKMRMPFPQNLEEQFEISKKLNRIMSLIHKEQTNLSKHQSLKKGLMQDLLTGKVEVEV